MKGEKKGLINNNAIFIFIPVHTPFSPFLCKMVKSNIKINIKTMLIDKNAEIISARKKIKISKM